MKDLNFYGDIYTAKCIEGEGYYIRSYTGADTFNGDEMLKKLFINAKQGMDNFYNLLESRIIDLGGNPEDYEA